MASFNERRRQDMLIQHCLDSYRVVVINAMDEDTFAVTEDGEVSLMNRATLGTLLQQLQEKA